MKFQMDDTDPIHSEKTHRLRLDDLCSEFEKEWTPDTPNSIKEFALRVDESLRSGLIQELVAVDCELRSEIDQTPVLDDYLHDLGEWDTAVEFGFVCWQTDQQHRAVPESRLSHPDQLGDYKIVRKIGQGGMGVVYEAVQDSLGRRVAIKTLSILHVARLTERFRREARAVAMLHHTNIIEVYGSGIDNGVPYFAMQLVQGKSLGKAISEARRLLEESGVSSPSKASHTSHELLGVDSRKHIAKIGIDVARALEHAHQQGVLHRDIKPSNLLVDKTGTTFVSDFGLAKLCNEQGDVTVSGDVIGTLQYIPPEAVSGEWTSQSDVYSLGITMYELLALKPAFSEKNHAKLLDRIARGDSPSSLSADDSSIPLDLETIVATAMSSDLKTRYQSAAHFADDLQRFVDGRPIRARRATATERLWKWSKRKPALAALMALAMSVVAIGFPVVTFLWLRSENALEFAEKKRVETEAARQEAVMANEAAEMVAYGNSIQLAHKYIEDGVAHQARRLLTQWVPKSTTQGEQSNDPRGWEWYFLKQQLDVSRQTFVSDSYSAVWSVAIRPDDAQVATVHTAESLESSELSGEVILWDPQTGVQQHCLRDHGSYVVGAAYSPDGTRLATVGVTLNDTKQRGTICLWNTETGEREKCVSIPGTFDMKNVNGFNGRTTFPSIRFSRDGERLMCSNPPIEIRDARTLERIADRPIEGRWVVEMPNDKLIALGGNQWLEYDASTGQRTRVIRHAGTLPFHADVSHDYSQVVATMAGFIRLWSAENPTPFQDFKLPGVFWCVFDAQGLRIAHGNRGGQLWIQPIKANGGSSRFLTGHQSIVTHGQFSHDGRWLVSGSMDGTARIWDVESSKHTLNIDTRCFSIGDFALSTTGTESYSACFRAAIRSNAASNSTITEDSVSTQIQSTYRAHWPRTDFCFSSDGQYFAAPMSEEEPPQHLVGMAQTGKVGIWSSHDWKLLQTIDTRFTEITSVTWNRDDKFVAVAGTTSGQSLVRIYSVTDSTYELTSELIVDGPVSALGFHRTQLAAATSDAIQVWNDSVTVVGEVSSAPSIASRFPHDGDVRYLDFSPNGDQLVAAFKGMDVIRVYDTVAGRLSYQKDGPRALCCARFSPDGQRLALSGYDSLVYLCDSKTGARLLTLNGSRDAPGGIGFTSRVVFSSDGKRIATNNWKHQIRVWKVDSDKP